MKRIEELYQEILQDEGLKAEFVQAAKDNQMEAFLQKNDCNDTPAELQKFAEKKQSELAPLSDTELDVAAGGFNRREYLESMYTLGVGCVLLTIVSLIGEGAGPREGVGTLLCHNVDDMGKFR